MEQLNISTGIKEFSLNGEVSVWFNPTDMDFITKVFETFDSLKAKQDAYGEALSGAKDPLETLEVMRVMNEDMRDRLQELFNGADIVTPLIGNANVYALADGLPIWANILFAIIDQMEGEFAEQGKQSRKRMAKYTAKYMPKDHKK